MVPADVKELLWRKKADWVDVYLHDMRKLEQVPEDWARAAQYHLDYQPGKISEVKVLAWNPTDVDKAARLIEAADIWCSLKVDGKPHMAMVSLNGEAEVDVFPGTPEEHLPYWADQEDVPEQVEEEKPPEEYEV